MNTFYCVGCRFVYPLEKSARISAGVHRDREPVGFCFLCARDIVPGGEELEPDAGDRDPAANNTASA